MTQMKQPPENPGRFRACAEIEDCVTHYLCHVAEITEGQALILLGKSSISTKKHIAETFSQARGEEETARFKALFASSTYSEVMKCRNTVAHGILLGITPDGHISFRVTELLEAGTAIATMVVNAYTTEGLASYAATAIAMAHALSDTLNHQETLEKRRARGLGHHPKARKAKPSEQRKRQPRSSPV